MVTSAAIIGERIVNIKIRICSIGFGSLTKKIFLFSINSLYLCNITFEYVNFFSLKPTKLYSAIKNKARKPKYKF